MTRDRVIHGQWRCAQIGIRHDGSFFSLGQASGAPRRMNRPQENRRAVRFDLATHLAPDSPGSAGNSGADDMAMYESKHYRYLPGITLHALNVRYEARRSKALIIYAPLGPVHGQCSHRLDGARGLPHCADMPPQGFCARSAQGKTSARLCTILFRSTPHGPAARASHAAIKRHRVRGRYGKKKIAPQMLPHEGQDIAQGRRLFMLPSSLLDAEKGFSPPQAAGVQPRR